MIHVLIVEDQAIIQQYFCSYLFKKPETFRVERTLASAGDAIDVCREKRIDLILMDVLTQGGASGLDAIDAIRAAFPAIKILVVTSLVDGEVLQKAKKTGADGLWYKDGPAEELMGVIEKILAGEKVFPDAPPAVKIGCVCSSEFTPKELETLRYVVRGLPYAEIAAAMEVDATTVKTHVGHMLDKTQLKNKLLLAMAARDAKFITDEALFHN